MDDSLKELPVELIFSQEGHVYLEENAHVTELVPSWVVEHVKPFFEQSSFLGVLHLGILHCLQVLPSGFCVWQHFSRKLLTEVCKKVQGEDGAFPIDLPFDEEFYQEWIDSAFGVKGFEYMSLERLKTLWEGVLKAFKQELTHTSLSAQGYLQKYNPTWGEVGRVCFHLAENKKDPSRPFAFLATYTSKLSKQQTAQHLPLHKALQEFHGEKHRPLLLSLLTCVQQVAKKSPWVQMLVEKGEIYHPKFLSSKEAYQFLQAIPHMEESGVLVRIPNWWNPKKPSRPQVVVQIEQAKDSKLGVDALLDFSLHMALDNGKIITQEEWEALLQ